MSKRCVKCELAFNPGEIFVHDSQECPRNYSGSSKGMECHGILTTVLKLHGKYDCVLDVIVMDDDSSSQNILQWNYDDAKIPKNRQWPEERKQGKTTIVSPKMGEICRSQSLVGMSCRTLLQPC